MKKNASTSRKIVNVLVIILVLILLVQNLSIVSVGFLLFSLKLPLIIVMAGLFTAGWFVSKAFGWEFDYEAMKKRYADMEDSLEKAVDKGLEEGKKAVDKVKDAAENIKEGSDEVADKTKEIANDAKDLAQDAKQAVTKVVNDAKKATTNKPAPRKTTTKRTPTRKTSK